MMKKMLFATTLVAFTAASSSFAYAADAKVTGLAGGAVAGAIVGGPVGAVVGGAVGLTAGAAIDNQKPRKVIIYKHHRNRTVEEQY